LEVRKRPHGNLPQIKKKVEKKATKTTPPTKSPSTAFYAGPLAPKKKAGVEQGELTPEKNITRFKARRTPFRLVLFYWVYS
jgi:hypothetical protein